MPDCTRCNRYFTSWNALYQHEANSPNHNICQQCDVDFTTRLGLKEHWVQSSQHSYCQYCDTHCADDRDLVDHYEIDHQFEWCDACRRVFKNGFGLTEHYRQSEKHHYCLECDRHFTSPSNLRSHLNSSIHRPKDVVCPGCSSKFVSPSALITHLEYGTCPSGHNRDSVNRFVQQHDTHNIITDPSRMLTGPSSSSSSSTPFQNQNQSVTYIATSDSWNPSAIAYECCLCYNTYRTLASLNQHLSSPRHQDQIYICRGPECGQRFSVLSALVQHIESEKCGVSRFRAVQNAMNNVFGRMGVPLLTTGME